MKNVKKLKIFELAKSALKITIMGELKNSVKNAKISSRHRSILAQCGHVLCFHCATTIQDNSPKDKAACPTCRRNFNPDQVIKIFEATIS